ncbi:MAG: trypsin-like peptidase domain-containing protein [Cyanobacteria bacterium P01_E01_bin.34]
MSHFSMRALHWAFRQTVSFCLICLVAQLAIVTPTQASSIFSAKGLQQGTLLAQAALISDPDFVADAVERIGPAVVRINSSRTISQSSPFGDRGSEQRGEGSGFIVTDDGLIFTNAHVLEGAERVEVVLQDGRRFEGKVIGADPLTDVAVVDIDAEELPVAEIGDSRLLTPGEWAIAIGNPLGLDSTVTVGIISAVGRSAADVGIPMQRAQFIQTDAAINPGNSGGPLLNERGEVIAINTAIIRGANGIGFAVPIRTAQRIANQLVATGRVSRAYLGIQMSTLTPELRDRINDDPNSNFNVDADRGVLVQSVAPDGPAASAGLRAGDVILSINGEDITSSDQLQQYVEFAAVGDRLEIAVSRNGEERTIVVLTGEFPLELVSG